MERSIWKRIFFFMQITNTKCEKSNQPSRSSWYSKPCQVQIFFQKTCPEINRQWNCKHESEYHVKILCNVFFDCKVNNKSNFTFLLHSLSFHWLKPRSRRFQSHTTEGFQVRMIWDQTMRISRPMGKLKRYERCIFVEQSGVRICLQKKNQI